MRVRPFNIMREPLTKEQAKKLADENVAKCSDELRTLLDKYNCKLDDSGDMTCVVVTQDHRQVYADLPWRYNVYE
jgi:hypothetical protein